MEQFDKDELKKRLTDEQFRVTQEKGTEAPYTGEYEKTTITGEYNCIVCGHTLFASENKFDAGCGWPSFDRSKSKEAVVEKEDNSHGMRRTEVVCSNCGAHLGHVFPDGPRETTGIRYCINSASLQLKPKPKP